MVDSTQYLFFFQYSSYYGTRWYTKVFPGVSNMDTDSGYFYLLKTSNTKVATVSYFHFAINEPKEILYKINP